MTTPNDPYRSVDLVAQEKYWRTRLGDNVPAVRLHLDHPRPPVPAFLRASAAQELDLHLCRRINHLCGRTNSTLDVCLLAAFETLLLRYTGQEVFIIRSLSSDSHRWLD